MSHAHEGSEQQPLLGDEAFVAASRGDEADGLTQPDAPPAGHIDVGLPCVLTNRSNLVHWLSSGLIGPYEQFAGEKYYEDLLSMVPGRLVVFTGPLGYAVDLVVQGDVGQFPVAIELEPWSVEPLEPLAADSQTGAAVGLTRSWIPTSAIRRVVFRSDDEYSEYAVRNYENAHPAEPAAIEPGVFVDDGFLTSVDLRGLLADVAGSDEQVVAMDRLKMADRCSGAVCMVLAALPADSRYAGGFPWVSSASVDLDGLAAGLRHVLGKAACSAPGVLEACLYVVSKLRRSEGWNPLDVLDDLKEQLHAVVAKGRQKRIAAQMDHADRVLGLEATLDLSEATLADDVLTAMLVFVLHPKPTEALEWTESAGASSKVVVLTAAFAGLAEGMARLDTRFKTPRLMGALATWYLDGLGLPGERGDIPGGLAAHFEPTRDIGGRLDISLGGLPLMSREKVSTTDLLLAGDLTSAGLSDTLVGICRAMAWDDCICHEIVIRSSRPVELQSIDHISLVKRIAAGLEVHLAAAAQGVVVRFTGSRAERSFPDEAALRLRLESQGLSAEVGSEFRDAVMQTASARSTAGQRNGGH